MTRRQRERATDIVLVLVIILLASLMAGCTWGGGALQVRVPVPVPCQEKEPDAPFMATDSLSKGANIEQFARAARAELLQREGYEGRLRAALRACIKPLS